MLPDRQNASHFDPANPSTAAVVERMRNFTSIIHIQPRYNNYAANQSVSNLRVVQSIVAAAGRTMNASIY